MNEPTTQTGPLHLAIIIGSTRAGGFGERIAKWFAGEAGRHGGYAVEVVDLRRFERLGWTEAGGDPAIGEFLERIERADAIAIVTPEYNHGYPAALKHAIDQGYSEWHAKPIGFVSYGGMSGGLRAVEQLRQVFSEFHTVTMRDTVSFHRVHREFDAAGMPHDLAGAGEAAQVMLRQLAWWGETLRQARVTRPYVVAGGPLPRPAGLLPSPS
jgi:NAD(P)H-dependent FMN reductase